MVIDSNNLVAAPILIPLAGAMLALLLRKRPRLQAAFALVAMIVALAASAVLLVMLRQTGEPIVLQVGGWPAPFGISLVGDWLALFFVLMAQIAMVLGITYAMGSKDAVIGYPMFYPLFLMLAAALTGAFLTGDLFNLFVFAELLVVSGTVLAAASDDRLGTEAAYKYFYMSLLASTFMLLAIGSLYASYGTLNMADLAARIAAGGNPPLLLPAMGFLLATFMIKGAVFPFHFWQPDIYSAAPTAVSAVLSSVVGKLGIYGFLRMTTLLFVAQAAEIRTLLLLLGIAGIIFGGLSAIGTHNVKRMLAYSTLAQVGFILVGIGWGTAASLAAALIFAFNHSLIKAAMMMLAGFVASRTPTKSAAFKSVTGAGRALPAAGVLFFLGSLGLAGVPPTNGFISKAFLFSSGIDAEAYTVLTLIGVASILTFIYTTRAFQLIWWRAPAGEETVQASGDRLIAPAILILLVLLLGIWAEPLIMTAIETSHWLADPAGYITAVLGQPSAVGLGD